MLISTGFDLTLPSISATFMDLISGRFERFQLHIVLLNEFFIYIFDLRKQVDIFLPL